MTEVDLRAFSSLTDTVLVASWLSRAHVTEWWGDGAKVLSDLAERDPRTAAVILEAGRPVGLLCWQTPSANELEDAGLSDLPKDIMDIDIMIGEEDALGRSVGPRALRRLVAHLANEGVRVAGLATSVKNRRAIAAFEKVGFLPFREFLEDGQRYRYFTKSLRDAV